VGLLGKLRIALLSKGASSRFVVPAWLMMVLNCESLNSGLSGGCGVLPPPAAAPSCSSCVEYLCTRYFVPVILCATCPVRAGAMTAPGLAHSMLISARSLQTALCVVYCGLAVVQC
jgi:hypothetical protein